MLLTHRTNARWTARLFGWTNASSCLWFDLLMWCASKQHGKVGGGGRGGTQENFASRDSFRALRETHAKIRKMRLDYESWALCACADCRHYDRTIPFGGVEEVQKTTSPLGASFRALRETSAKIRKMRLSDYELWAFVCQGRGHCERSVSHLQKVLIDGLDRSLSMYGLGL